MMATRLEVLNLLGPSMGFFTVSIPVDLSELTNLQQLKLQDTLFSDVLVLPHTISTLTIIRGEGKSLYQIPGYLRRLKHLTIISSMPPMVFNHFYDRGCDSDSVNFSYPDEFVSLHPMDDIPPLQLPIDMISTSQLHSLRFEWLNHLDDIVNPPALLLPRLREITTLIFPVAVSAKWLLAAIGMCRKNDYLTMLLLFGLRTNSQLMLDHFNCLVNVRLTSAATDGISGAEIAIAIRRWPKLKRFAVAQYRGDLDIVEWAADRGVQVFVSESDWVSSFSQIKSGVP